MNDEKTAKPEAKEARETQGTTAAAKPAKKRPLVRAAKAVAWTAGGIVLVSVTAVGIAAWLVLTPSGLKTAADVGCRFLPDLGMEGSIAAVEGDWSGLKISDIHFAMPGVVADVGTLELSLDWRQFFDKKLHVTDFSLTDVKVDVDTTKLASSETTEEEPTVEESGLLAAPLPIALDSIRLANAALSVDGMTVDLGRCETGMTWEGDLVAVKPTLLEALAFAMPKVAENDEAGSEAATEAAPEVTTEASVQGEAQSLQTAASVETNTQQKTDNQSEPPVEEKPSAGPENSTTKAPTLGETLHAFFEKPFLTELPAVELPLNVTLERVTASNIKLENLPGTEGLPGFAPFEVKMLELSAKLEKTGIVSLPVFSVDSSVGRVGLEAQVELANDWPIFAKAKIETEGEPYAAIFAPDLHIGTALAKVTASVSGALMRTISVLADVDAKFVAEETTFKRSDPPKEKIDLETAGDKPREEPQPPVPEVKLPELINDQRIRVSLSIKAAPAEAGLPIDVHLFMPALKWPLVETAAMLSAPESPKRETEEARKQTKTDEKTSANVKASGQAELPPPAVLEIVAPDRFHVEDLILDLSGRADNWVLTSTTTLKAEMPSLGLGAPFDKLAADLTFAASGSLTEASLTTLDVKSSLGRVALEGLFGWADGYSWNTKTTVEGIALDVFEEKVPCTLGAKLATDGSFKDRNEWRANVSMLDVEGSIQKAPIILKGSFSADSDENLNIPDFLFRLGKNKVTLKGHAESIYEIDLKADLDIPGLINTVPGLSGTAKGYVSLGGSASRPKINADLKVSGLSYEDQFCLGSLTFAADIKNYVERRRRSGSAAAEGERKLTEDELAQLRERIRARMKAQSADVKIERIVTALSSGELDGTINLAVKDLNVSGQKIDAIMLKTEGRERAHTITLSADGGPVEGKIVLAGGIDRSTFDWTGNLKSASLTTPAGQWMLASPASIAVDSKKPQATIGKHCWKQEHATVCIPEPIVAGMAGHAKVRLESLDMTILQPYLQKRDKIDGHLTGDASVTWDLGKSTLPDASMSIVGDGLSYSTRYQGVRFPVKLETLRASASFKDGKAEAALMIKPDGNGTISSRLVVDDPLGERSFRGDLKIEDLTPSTLKPFFAEGEKAAGRVNADLHAFGTVEEPRLSGVLSLDDFSFDASYIPVDMKPSSIKLTFDGNKSTLEGAIETESGTLAVSGAADWTDITNWHARIGAKGEKIRISMPPMIQVDVSPDVEAKADPELISLSGIINVPWAKIEVGEIPESSGTSVSSDEVMLDEDLKPVAKASSPIALKSSIAVKLGNQISIDAFGLKAGLSGNVVIVQDDQRLGLNGQITIPYGRFHAYGQDLLIQKGAVIFSGPANDPSLNIEAIRNPEVTEDDVTAGIRVTGTASSPKVTLFSDPAKSQEETLSYLVRGQGLASDDEGGTSAAMMSMLIGLGASTSNGIVSEIGDTLGIEGLGLDTTGVGDDSQVVVSGYVFPGLQVKYGMGIFDSLATLTLRYRLMPRLYLEAVSGVDQALDLLYRFDFN